MDWYRRAGVDLEGAERHVSAIAQAVVSTWGQRVVGGFGGFAAGVELPAGYRRPVLMMTTDGVGTKLELARRYDGWDGVGQDLVAMCVDDLAAAGAAPLGLVDYLAVGSLDPERDRRVVASVAAACAAAGCPLLGGETAEHPGVMAPDAVDLAGAALGVVEHDAAPGPARVRTGDLILGLASPNLRSNGFSLVRAVLADELDDHHQVLLEPSVIYSPEVLAAMATGGVHSAAHITGGGIPGNLPRALPPGRGALIRQVWEVPAPFVLIAGKGVPTEEMRSTFNLGIGFCLVVDPAMVDLVAETVARHDPLVIGEVTESPGLRWE